MALGKVVNVQNIDLLISASSKYVSLGVEIFSPVRKTGVSVEIERIL